jgi:hypothetical protein
LVYQASNIDNALPPELQNDQSITLFQEENQRRGQGIPIWAELQPSSDTNHYLSSSFGNTRPLYLKLPAGCDYVLPSKTFLHRTEVEDCPSDGSSRYYVRHRTSEKNNEDRVRTLTPSLFRSKPEINDDKTGRSDPEDYIKVMLEDAPNLTASNFGPNVYQHSYNQPCL